VKTVVYQSYRTVNVPAWISRCMQTVKDWALVRGFDYHFIDDRFFEYAPAWYREKVNHDVLLVSDLCRLIAARELLSKGYQRTIWVDADVVVFDPENFRVDVSEGYAFCREVWIGLGQGGRFFYRHSVNNAVTVFVQGNSFLEFYIDACQSRIRHIPLIDRIDASTRFLTHLHELMHLNLMNHVGLLSPLVLADLVRGTETMLKAYMVCFGAPIFAANLCSSFGGQTYDGVMMHDGVYGAALEKLVQTKGSVINRFHGLKAESRA